MKLIMENWRKFVDSCEAESRLIEEKKKRTKKKKKRKKSFPDLTGDGKVTRADVILTLRRTAMPSWSATSSRSG